MYRRLIDEVMDELLDEYLNEIEGEVGDQRYYYWETWHNPAYEWKFKERTSYESLTTASANNKHVQYWNTWFKKMGLSGGWLYIARYYWNGQKWVRDRCDILDVTRAKYHPCA